MEKFKVELLPAANDDLNEILDYILIENAIAAEEVLEKIMSALNHLKTFPHSGMRLIENSLVHLQFRMVVIKPYVVFYKFVDDKVLIYRILHEARDTIHILRDSE